MLRETRQIFKGIPDLDDVHRYLKYWRDDEYWRDYNVMVDRSLVDIGAMQLAADWIVSAGAIDYTQHEIDSHEYDMEFYIEKLSREYRDLSPKAQDKITNRVFKGCHLYECQECNHVSVLHDGNEKLYSEELKSCWGCKGTKIKHSIWKGR